MTRRYTLVAVTLPLLAIGLGIVRAELFLRRAHDFVFEITGYDPRDLLRGHYLQFQLKVDPVLEREPCEDDAGGLCCLCLTRIEGEVVVRAERATCATARASCEGALDTRYFSAAQRYYVPEHRAAELERRLRDAMQRGGAQALVAVDQAGTARVRELLIDGEPISGAVAR
jgi:uncharacterized membrane-anchored protein